MTPTSRADSRSRRRRVEPKSFRVSTVPVRGETDLYGETFSGLPGNRLAVNAVGTDELDTRAGSRAVSEGAIRDNAVGERALSGFDGGRAVAGRHLQSDILEGRHFTSGSVDETALAALAVKTGKIGDKAVTSGKIDDGAVGPEKLGAQAVGTPKIEDGAVSIAKLGAGVKGGENDGGPPPQDKGVRKLFGSGTSRGAAHSDHNHSVSPKGTPLEVRRLVIKATRKLAGGSATQDDRDALLLALAHFVCDDPEETLAERQERFDADPSGLAERRYLDDNLPHHTERMDGGRLPRFYREPPPVLARHLGA